MKVNDKNIKTTVEQLFSTNNDFYIPYFQRNYSWNKKIQVDMLLNDSFFYDDINFKNKKNHFWGVVVSKKSLDLDGKNKLLIIDGQQRLATLSLVFKAILDIFDIFLSIEQKEKLNSFLYSNITNEIKLKLQMDNNKIDNSVYKSIIQKKVTPDSTNNLFIAYNYICERLKDKNMASEEISCYVSKLINTNIVHIILEDDEDNPQNVFESLNSKGMELSIADLVKNYIFMNISSQEKQKDYYLTYWKHIENSVSQSDKEIANFLRDYMVIKFEKVIQEINKDLYYEFRKNVQFSDENIEANLDDLTYWFNLFLSCSNNFANDTLSKNGNYQKFEKINKIMNKTFIYQGPIKLGYVVLIKLADLFFRDIIDENKLKKSVEVINNYVTMWEFKTSRGYLHNAFINLIKKLNDYDSKKDASFGEIIEKSIINQKGQFSVLKKSEFKQLFISSSAQNLNKYITKIIEVRCNTMPYDELEKKSKSSDLKFNLEHIFPESPPDDMKTDMIFKTESIWKMGNLAMCEREINDKVANKQFEDKKNAYKETGLRVLKIVSEKNEWTLDTIEEVAEEKFNIYYSNFEIKYNRPIF